MATALDAAASKPDLIRTLPLTTTLTLKPFNEIRTSLSNNLGLTPFIERLEQYEKEMEGDVKTIAGVPSRQFLRYSDADEQARKAVRKKNAWTELDAYVTAHRLLDHVLRLDQRNKNQEITPTPVLCQPTRLGERLVYHSSKLARTLEKPLKTLVEGVLQFATPEPPPSTAPTPKPLRLAESFYRTTKGYKKMKIHRNFELLVMALNFVMMGYIQPPDASTIIASPDILHQHGLTGPQIKELAKLIPTEPSPAEVLTLCCNITPLLAIGVTGLGANKNCFLNLIATSKSLGNEFSEKIRKFEEVVLHQALLSADPLGTYAVPTALSTIAQYARDHGLVEMTEEESDMFSAKNVDHKASFETLFQARYTGAVPAYLQDLQHLLTSVPAPQPQPSTSTHPPTPPPSTSVTSDAAPSAPPSSTALAAGEGVLEEPTTSSIAPVLEEGEVQEMLVDDDGKEKEQPNDKTAPAPPSSTALAAGEGVLEEPTTSSIAPVLEEGEVQEMLVDDDGKETEETPGGGEKRKTTSEEVTPTSTPSSTAPAVGDGKEKGKNAEAKPKAAAPSAPSSSIRQSAQAAASSSRPVPPLPRRTFLAQTPSDMNAFSSDLAAAMNRQSGYRPRGSNIRSDSDEELDELEEEAYEVSEQDKGKGKWGSTDMQEAQQPDEEEKDETESEGSTSSGVWSVNGSERQSKKGRVSSLYQVQRLTRSPSRVLSSDDDEEQSVTDALRNLSHQDSPKTETKKPDDLGSDMDASDEEIAMDLDPVPPSTSTRPPPAVIPSSTPSHSPSPNGKKPNEIHFEDQVKSGDEDEEKRKAKAKEKQEKEERERMEREEKEREERERMEREKKERLEKARKKKEREEKRKKQQSEEGYDGSSEGGAETEDPEPPRRSGRITQRPDYSVQYGKPQRRPARKKPRKGMVAIDSRGRAVDLEKLAKGTPAATQQALVYLVEKIEEDEENEDLTASKKERLNHAYPPGVEPDWKNQALEPVLVHQSGQAPLQITLRVPLDADAKKIRGFFDSAYSQRKVARAPEVSDPSGSAPPPPPPSPKTVYYTTHSHYKDHPLEWAKKLATGAIVLSGTPVEKAEFDLSGLRTIGMLDHPVDVQDQTRPVIGENFQQRVVTGDLRTIHRTTLLDTPKAINGLYFPQPTPMFFPNGLASDSAAERGLLGDPNCPPAVPTRETHFAICATEGAHHFVHVDSCGQCVAVTSRCGEKAWFLAFPKDQDAVYSIQYHDDLDVTKLDREKFDIHCIILRAGDTVIMPPHTYHLVYTSAHAICQGSYFLSTPTIRDTIAGMIHCFFRGNIITNNDAPTTPGRLNTIMQLNYRYLVCRDFSERDRPHLFDMTDPEGVYDLVLTACAAELQCLWDPDSYKPTSDEALLRSFKMHGVDAQEALLENDINASSYQFRRSAAYSRGCMRLILEQIKENLTITSDGKEQDLWSFLFIPMLSQLLCAFRTYRDHVRKQVAEDEGMENSGPGDEEDDSADSDLVFERMVQAILKRNPEISGDWENRRESKVLFYRPPAYEVDWDSATYTPGCEPRWKLLRPRVFGTSILDVQYFASVRQFKEDSLGAEESGYEDEQALQENERKGKSSSPTKKKKKEGEGSPSKKKRKGGKSLQEEPAVQPPAKGKGRGGKRGAAEEAQPPRRSKRGRVEVEVVEEPEPPR